MIRFRSHFPLDQQVAFVSQKRWQLKGNKKHWDLHWVRRVPVDVAQPVGGGGRLADQVDEGEKRVDEHLGRHVRFGRSGSSHLTYRAQNKHVRRGETASTPARRDHATVTAVHNGSGPTFHAVQLK